jgi:hypothetical protein
MDVRITQTRAIEIANAEFAGQGNKLGDYDVSIDPTLFEGRYWLVIYDRKGAFPAPGGKHIVRVDIESGDATFLKGQ